MANGRQSAVELAQQMLAKAEEVEDPWLISYADLVTNLLAFMVVLVSLAGISFEGMDAIEGMFDSKQAAQPNLQTLSTEIQELAQQEGLQDQIAAAVDREGLAIQLSDQILFPSGVASLSPSGKALVDKVARLIEGLPDKYRIRVEGHTDDVPISTPRFRSNWELSASRAIEVRDTLASQSVSQNRLSISAYADTRPIPSEPGLSVDEIRRRNRRVVIRVYY